MEDLKDLRIRRFREGFVIVEVMVALVLISLILILAISKYPLRSTHSVAEADKTASAVSCWIQCVNYYASVKGDYPSTLDDAKNLGNCLCADAGVSYNKDTNGVYFCYEKYLNSVYDLSFMKLLKRNTGGYLNTTCPSKSDSDVDVGQTAYLTVWLSMK